MIKSITRTLYIDGRLIESHTQEPDVWSELADLEQIAAMLELRKRPKKTQGFKSLIIEGDQCQGAEIVVFEFDMDNGVKVQREIVAIRKLGINGYYYFSNDKTQLYTI